jgi:hypothetical protein
MRFRAAIVVEALTANCAHKWPPKFQSFESTIRPVKTALYLNYLHREKAIPTGAGGLTMLP